jgi:hypothetical protein
MALLVQMQFYGVPNVLLRIIIDMRNVLGVGFTQVYDSTELLV